MSRLTDYDNRDDRVEIRILIHKLHPGTRWTFLEWCASQCKTQSGKRPGVIVDQPTRLRLDEATRRGGAADDSWSDIVYVMIWQLHVCWQLDLSATLAKLTALARGKESAADVKRELLRANHENHQRQRAEHSV